MVVAIVGANVTIMIMHAHTLVLALIVSVLGSWLKKQPDDIYR